MTIDPADLFSPLLLLLLGVIGYLTRTSWNRIEGRLDGLEKTQAANTVRLARIETKLGIPELNGHDAA